MYSVFEYTFHASSGILVVLLGRASSWLRRLVGFAKPIHRIVCTGGVKPPSRARLGIQGNTVRLMEDHTLGCRQHES